VLNASLDVLSHPAEALAIAHPLDNGAHEDLKGSDLAVVQVDLAFPCCVAEPQPLPAGAKATPSETLDEASLTGK
jgi:hypothetical protein